MFQLMQRFRYSDPLVQGPSERVQPAGQFEPHKFARPIPIGNFITIAARQFCNSSLTRSNPVRKGTGRPQIAEK